MITPNGKRAEEAYRQLSASTLADG